MEHFAAVQSIIRAGLTGDQVAFDRQVARLRKRLIKAGQVKEAETIDRLIKAAEEVKDLTPSRVEVSRTPVSGEQLTQDTNPPIDRETGARLCSIDFPSAKHDRAPIYDLAVNNTIEGLLSEWMNAAALQDVGVDPTRSLLIFGPPGSGKTLTAHYIAQQLQLPLITARIDGLISSFLGTTARNIANLFDFANRYACVLLLDEFDALAKLPVAEAKPLVEHAVRSLSDCREPARAGATP